MQSSAVSRSLAKGVKSQAFVVETRTQQNVRAASNFQRIAICCSHSPPLVVGGRKGMSSQVWARLTYN